MAKKEGEAVDPKTIEAGNNYLKDILAHDESEAAKEVVVEEEETIEEEEIPVEEEVVVEEEETTEEEEIPVEEEVVAETNEESVVNEKTSKHPSWKELKHLQKERQELRERIARLEGVNEGRQPKTEETIQPPIPNIQIDGNIAEQIRLLDEAQNNAETAKDYNEYITTRIILANKGVQAQEARQQVAVVQAQKFSQAVEKRKASLPRFNEAFSNLNQDKMAITDPAVNSQILEHLDDGGIDLLVWLGTHPDYRRNVMVMPVFERGAELIRKRKELFKTPNSVVKKVIKPTTKIQNSIVSSGKKGDNDAYEQEMEKIRNSR